MKNMLSEALCELRGLLNQLFTNLGGEQGVEWLAEFKKFLRKEKCWTGIIVEPILKLISGDEDVALDACDGKRIIAKAKNIFPAGIDSDFVNWNADEPGQPTQETQVDVYEMTKDATFSQMFGSLCADVSRLCLTQDQILHFVEKHPERLRTDGYATFFLFKSHGHFFVAYVNVCSVGLYVHVDKFEDAYVWRAAYRRRVVVPKLA